MKYCKHYSVIIQIENFEEAVLFSRVLALASSKLKSIKSKKEREKTAEFILELANHI